jgi:hypothetical protein
MTIDCLYKDKEKVITFLEIKGYNIIKGRYFRKAGKEMYRIETEEF